MMAFIKFFESIKKTKNIDEYFLHSEWNHSLGFCTLTAMNVAMVISLTFHFILPVIFANLNLSRAHCELSILPFFATLMLVYFGAYQLSHIARKISKSCILYQFTGVAMGQGLAFFVSFSQNLLLTIRDNLPSRHALSITLLVVSWIIHFCAYRIFRTICVTFSLTTLFTTISCTIVAILHNFARLKLTVVSSERVFDEVINASNWLVIGFLCTESLALISEETDQPHILPQLFRCFALFEFILSLIALIVFFPFVLRIKFEEDTLLPLAFDSISIFSARYLMNVGSTCGLLASLLCSFLPPSRILCTLAKDFLLVDNSTKKLAAFTNSIVLFVTILLVVAIPRKYLSFFLPLNVMLRLCVQALIILCSSFDLKKQQKFPTENMLNHYKRMRTLKLRNFDDISDDKLSDACLDSEFSTSDSLWRYQTHDDVMKAFLCYASVNNYPTNKIEEKLIHNCHSDICHSGNNLLSKNGYKNVLVDIDGRSKIVTKSLQNHIYDVTHREVTVGNEDCQPADSINIKNPESIAKTANFYILAYLLTSILFSISHKIVRKTENHHPILAWMIFFSSILLLPLIAVKLNWIQRDLAQLYERDKEFSNYQNFSNKRLIFCCLASIFLSVQFLSFHSATKYLAFCFACLLGLLLFYIISHVQLRGSSRTS